MSKKLKNAVALSDGTTTSLDAKWGEKKDDESEAAGGSEKTAGSAAKVSRTAEKSTKENGISLYSDTLIN